MKYSIPSLILTLGLAAGPAATAAETDQALSGWNLLSPEWNQHHPLDFMTIEWEYFMVHDHEGRFNGIVGYVLTNPRGKGGPLGSMVVPKGGNIAIGGQINGRPAIGEYINFGIANTEVSSSTIDTRMQDPKTGYWASMTGLHRARPALHLQGETKEFTWDLIVEEAAHDIMERSRQTGAAFILGSDKRRAGRIPGESWTVDALWPRTKVQGTITVRATGEVIPVDGKGYRENSWGRYAMPFDGWDFLVFSEEDEAGVTAVLQTYHHSKDLDFVDLAFMDQGQRKILRFEGKTREFQWRHQAWSFDARARQCVPMDWDIVLENAEYRVLMEAVMPTSAQAPFLSNATIGTSAFFIQEQYPSVNGAIYRRADDSLVTTFAGQAGGEFALHKSFAPQRSAAGCAQWGRRFSSWYAN
jgi:hypothetical protein